MNIKTITTTNGVNEVDFGSNASRFYWFQNIGTTAVHVSGNADIVAGADGVAELAAGDSVCIEALGGKVYVLGAGKVQIHNTGDKFCPFKNAPAQSGGEAVDAYTKSESDAKYAQKTDIPSSLPANGGNADTVGGKVPEKIFYDNGLSADLNGATQSGCYAASPDTLNAPSSSWWLVDTMNFDNQFIVQKAHTIGNTAHTVSYIRNYANNAWSDWEQISTTPIKSTTFSGTTNEYGNVVFTAVGNKIPVFAECSPYCGIPLRFNDNYWIHCIDPITNSNSIAANTAVTGTVYYVEI